jgi:hypothetical protein
VKVSINAIHSRFTTVFILPSLFQIIGMVFLLLPTTLDLSAQTRIAVLDFRCGPLEIGFSDFLVGPAEGSSTDCRSLQNAVSSALNKDARVQLITHTEQDAVEAERELQRQEDFMEGYVVEQWMARGVEYFLTGSISSAQQRLVLNLHRSYDQNLMISKELTSTSAAWSQAGERRRLVLTALQQVLTELFPADVPLVKVIAGSKSKARTILIAGGSKQHLQRHQELVVKTTVIDNDGENVRSRSVTIASIVVEEVENENFSRCVIMSGGRAVQEALDKGQEVFVEGF